MVRDPDLVKIVATPDAGHVILMTENMEARAAEKFCQETAN